MYLPKEFAVDVMSSFKKKLLKLWEFPRNLVKTPDSNFKTSTMIEMHISHFRDTYRKQYADGHGPPL